MAHSHSIRTSGRQPRTFAFVRGPAAAFGLGLLLVYTVVSPLLFSSTTLGAFEFPKLMLLTLTAIILAALGVCALARQSTPVAAPTRSADGRIAFWRKPLLLGFVLFLLSAVASTAASIGPLTSLLGTHESHAGLWTVAAATVLFLGVRGLCRTYTDARLLLGGCVVAAAGASAYALLQAAGVDPVAWVGLSSIGAYIRPFGPLGHPNFLAAYLVMTLPLTVHFAGRAAARRHWAAFGVLALVALASCLAVGLSASRAAWLALGCALLVLLGGAVCARRWRVAAALALLPLAAGALLAGLLAWGGDHPLLATLRQRLDHLTDASTRGHIWSAGLAIFRDHPLLGCGPDAFQIAFAPKRTAAYWQLEWNVTPARAHNEAIHVLATQGLVGAAALVLLLAGLAVTGVRAWRRAPAEARPWLLAVLAGTAGFVVQNAFGFTVVACGALFATFAGLLARFGEEAPADVQELPPARCRWWPVALGCAGVLTALVFGVEFFGAEHVGHAAAAGAVVAAALAATGWALLRGAPDGQTAVVPEKLPAKETVWPAAWRGLVRVGAWAGAAVLVFVAVLRPLHANILCRAAERVSLTQPRAAVEMFAEAAFADPIRELYWSKLGGAAQVAARQVPGRNERVELFRLARTALQRACALSPCNAYHHANLGQLLGRAARERCADVRDAYAAYDRALALDGSNVNFCADAANAALGARDWARARGYAERGAALDPHFAPVRAQLGYLALVDKRHVDAVNLFCEAAHGDWHDASAARAIGLANLGTAYTNLGLHAAAADAYRQAVALAPHVADMHCNLAAALERSGRADEAAVEYRQALAAAPDHRGAQAGLARVANTPVSAPERRW